MTAPNGQDPNPLQLGEVLYAILDATVVATPKGAASPQYNRVQFTTAGSSIVDRAPLASAGTIVDGGAFPDPLTGTTPVFLLTADGVSMIGAAGGARASTWNVTPPCSRIVGLDPVQTQKRTLLLLGQERDAPFLLPVTCMDEGGGPRKALPLAGVAGSVQRGLLVRQQLSARVVVASISNSRLLLYDLGSSLLGPSPAAPASYPSVDLGAVAADSTVAIASATLLGSADQQIAVAFLDQQRQLSVAVAGWLPAGTLVKLAAWTSSPSAKPEAGPPMSALAMSRPALRIATGDVVAAGVDQIVIGFPATFKDVAGCAALLLFELSGTTASPALTLKSTYAVATADQPPQPLASIDLHLAAGLFGQPLAGDSPDAKGVLGVAVIGCGASGRNLVRGEALVTVGLVPVSPTTRFFPPLTTAPGVPQYVSTVVTVGADTRSIIALPSDVSGNSVVLGPPVLSQTAGARGQLLAVVQVPPYEKANSSQVPSLTLTRGKTVVEGYNVASNKMWMFSRDTGVTLGIRSLTLGRNMSESYGTGFSKLEDSSTTTQLQLSNTISFNDMLVLYATQYDIWTYPVYRKAVRNKPDGTLAVIFPQTATPIQTVIPASDGRIGFKPLSQVGTLLSYLDVAKPGYDSAKLMFELVSYPVSDETGGANVTYDKTVMKMKNEGVDRTVHNSATDSVHFTFNTQIFDYVPLNFGLNMTDGVSYSENDVKTTSVSFTEVLTISITSGSVPDIQYGYQVTPYIYQDDEMGCLTVAYNVSLDGKGWRPYYEKNSVMPVMLMSPMARSKNPQLAYFSRDISFADRSDGSVDITVTVFNNSLTAATNVTCELYLGAPRVVPGVLVLLPPGSKPDATKTLPVLNGAARGTITFNARLAKPSQVTVKVYTGEQQRAGLVYWGIYPPAEFMAWQALSAL